MTVIHKDLLTFKVLSKRITDTITVVIQKIMASKKMSKKGRRK